jgi:hypothetical protein
MQYLPSSSGQIRSGAATARPVQRLLHRVRQKAVSVTVKDVAVAGTVKNRAAIVQKKTGRPVQFEITDQARAAVGDLIQKHRLSAFDFLFHSRLASDLPWDFRTCPSLNDERPEWAPTRAYGPHSSTGLRHQLKSFGSAAEPT